MSQLQQEPEPADRLSTLPDDVLGKVFTCLRDLRTPVDVVDESSQALLQTCKAIHSSPACLAQISTLNLYIDKRCASMADQLRALPPGARVSRVRIAGNREHESHCIDNKSPKDEECPQTICYYSHSLEAGTMQALARDVARYTPWIQQSVTELELGRSSTVNGDDCVGQEAVIDCLSVAFPRMVSLKMYSGLDDCYGSAWILPTTHELRLRSLVLEPCNSCWGSRLNPMISEMETLTSLTLSNFLYIEDIADFQSLTNLKSLSLNFVEAIGDLSPLSTLTGLSSLTLSLKGEPWEDPPGLLHFLNAGCTGLRELSLGGLRVRAKLRLPKLERLHLMQRHDEALVPRLQSLPALKALDIDRWTVKGVASALSTMLVSLPTVRNIPHGISFTLASLVVKCDALSPCACLLQSLPPDYVLPSLRCLQCDNVQFKPQQLALLARHFPDLLELKTRGCELSASSLLEVVQCFPRLRRFFMCHPTMSKASFGYALSEAKRCSNKALPEAHYERWRDPSIYSDDMYAYFD